MKRIEIKELKIVGRQHFPLLGKAICKQPPLPTIGFWLGAGGLSALLPLAGGGCSSEACPLALPLKAGKTRSVPITKGEKVGCKHGSSLIKHAGLHLPQACSQCYLL